MKMIKTITVGRNVYIIFKVTGHKMSLCKSEGKVPIFSE